MIATPAATTTSLRDVRGLQRSSLVVILKHFYVMGASVGFILGSLFGRYLLVFVYKISLHLHILYLLYTCINGLRIHGLGCYTGVHILTCRVNKGDLGPMSGPLALFSDTHLFHQSVCFETPIPFHSNCAQQKRDMAVALVQPKSLAFMRPS